MNIHRILIAAILFFLLISLAQPLPAQASASDPVATALAARMPGLMAKYRVPGAVAAYIQNGAVTWTQAYGLADVAARKPMAPEMVFNFGSCGKVLTGWGIMRLVEQGRVALDAPVNQYLKRWQVQSQLYDVQQVTVRRLLSHTAGLSVHGFNDYSLRRKLPSLEEMLAGQNQADGAVQLIQPPGQGFLYSGGGYVLLQMMIEDVSGEPFEHFMQREVTGPLGLPGLQWSWTPDLMAAAPVPYGPGQEPVGYRQLASQAIGSELGTVTDFARFIAAAVSGPNGEPAGREVLQPATLAAMTAIQPHAGNEGLAYGVAPLGEGLLLQHFGANNGWTAFFSLDTTRRSGLVMATNSSNGFPLNVAVMNLWLAVEQGQGDSAYEPVPEPDGLTSANWAVLELAGLLVLPLLVLLVIFGLQIHSAKRARAPRPSRAGLLGAGFWVLVTLFWIYWFYTSLPLIFPPGFPDLWHMPQVEVVTSVLLGWAAFSAVSAWFPKNNGLR
jgi:CubicO group peptidase (beta-lactamase class C family)